MPKRIKDKNKSIFVKFYKETTDQEINNLLSSMDVSGVRVSNLVNRWAVEVPFWREQSYVEKLQENELVETVHEGFEKKRRNITDQEEQINDE